MPPAFEPAASSFPVPAASPAPTPATLPAVTPEYAIVHDRLTAIERLARLRDLGALSAEEFEAEKSIVLGLPADELVLHEALAPVAGDPALAAARTAGAPAPAPHRPSLLGRLLGWHLVPIGVVAGLAVLFVAQPRETWRFFDEALRLLGA
ncbi:SHOCT domain-containing protein [Sphingosinicella terrae]|uniref:SHOCT domain-containing protein n=1 Tax=Sphingosinicella terrae TaxID=2172047 RepID=UPI000E0CDFC2|nr:SHOCT domain-containing protein [Sphingosinicella terrae]